MSQKEIEAENDRNWPQWREKENLSYFLIGLSGEVGELMNCLKKYERFLRGWKGNYLTYEQFVEKLKDELPDIKIYLDLTAGLVGLDVEELVREKQRVNRKRFGWRE